MDKNTGIVVLVVVAVIALGVVYFAAIGSSSTFMAYPVFCEDWGKNPPAAEDFASCNHPYAYARMTFALDAAKSQITETSPDNGNLYVLNNCTIQDDEHWTCSGSNYDAFGAENPTRSGAYFSESGPFGPPVDTIFVTQEQWDSINNGAASVAQTTQSAPAQPAAPAQTTATTQATPTSQSPNGKCVTESGVQICDLSYQGTSDGGGTRAVTMQANEIICHDITTGLNSDIRGDNTTLNADPEFCATDYGSIYIDPTINVSKYYGAIQSNGQNYAVPSTESTCIWTYEGGSAAIPYIQAGSYIGPDLSYDQVHAFCQSVSNRLDIFTASQ